MEARKARGTVALDGDERWNAELAVGLFAMGHGGVERRRDPQIGDKVTASLKRSRICPPAVP